MRYVSEADLIAIDPWAYENQQDLLNAVLMKCREFNQWQPVDIGICYRVDTRFHIRRPSYTRLKN